MKNALSSLPVGELQARFLEILPRLELHGQVVFRDVKCEGRRQDAICELVGLCWLWFVRLVMKGIDPLRFPSALAAFAARQVRSGRRLTGKEKAKDVMSLLAQRRHRFDVHALPERSTLNGSPLEEALAENTQSPVPDQVAFRNDFRDWLRTRTDRDRRIIDDLMLGERTLDVADRHGVSPGRISQLCREFHADWQRFCSEPPTLVP